MMSERSWFRKQDILLIVCLLFVALVVLCAYTFLNRGTDNAVCEIVYDGLPVKRVELSQDATFNLEQNPHVRFEIKDHAIAFIESDCPDKVCIHSGFLSRQGQMAACLPNRVSIRIVSAEDDNDADLIAN